MQDNLDGYITGKITAGERRILLTNWVGEAWEELARNKEMIAQSFKKCGISVAADGSEDSEIHLEGLEDYQISREVNRDDEDPFANLSDYSSDMEFEELSELKRPTDITPFLADPKQTSHLS